MPEDQKWPKDPPNLDFTGKLEEKCDQIYMKGGEMLKWMYIEEPCESRLTAN